MASGKPRYDAFVDNGDEESGGMSDKQSLIIDGNPKFHEAVPLKDTHAYQHETICGFDGLKVIILSSIIFGFAITIAMVITIVMGEEQVVPHGAVSSDAQECSNIGADILKSKGSAVDAAIATMFCIGVVHSHSAGLGGGGFMMVYDSFSESRTVFDFQAAAPLNATENMFQSNPELARYGAKAIAIPGELLGMQAAYDTYGRLKWNDLVAPASKLARQGFKVSTSLANAISATDAEQMSEAWRNLYMPNGTPLQVGDTLVMTNLANTLDTIGHNGARAYFMEQLQKDMLNVVDGSDGLIDNKDFDKYDIFTTTPISVDYANFSIFSPPAPSGGPGLLSILKILSGYNLSTDATLRYHYTIEAIKFAKAQMLHLGDPNFVTTVENYTDAMISETTAENIRSMINSTSTHPISYYTDFANTLISGGTSHISILDESNNDLVSITHSLNSDFGSGVMTEGGIILNNIMDQFYWAGKDETTAMESTTNNIAGGKRPQSFQSPSLVWDLSDKCEPHMAIGGKSGSNTIDAIAQVLVSFLTLGEAIDTATNQMDHVYHSLEPNIVVAESGVSSDVISGLEALGHEVSQSTSNNLSMVNSVYEHYDEIYASADSREPDAGFVEF
ncbi:glutathione hydrolase 7-like isoform X2 [Anneissia japonica]|uniref:glutathione hydrolase 7-like isoform X2 n=1 Tax=Anneissia japonica TaxID=1529436 RepID=UPI001425AECA|nr:glutathione hydrolase 7-like isoform X2 [Anneissia japonica]